MADTCVFLMLNYTGNDFVNIGTCEDITIRVLTALTTRVCADSGWYEGN